MLLLEGHEKTYSGELCQFRVMLRATLILRKIKSTGTDLTVKELKEYMQVMCLK